jgi:hypothetical protein
VRLASSSLLLLALATAVDGRDAGAQRAVLVRAIADAELWATDSASTLLARNHGQPGMVGRVVVWGALELGPRVVAYAAGTLEGGNARRDHGMEWYTDMLGVRYLHSTALVADAGLMPHPLGAFASRRYSNRNPLIGVPDGYPVQYPLGVQLSGIRGPIDYRGAVVSLPVANESYVPAPGTAARPVLGVGYTPMVGARVGVSATWGPYLDAEMSPALLGGEDWRAYAQRIGALDVRLSRGYLEMHGELAASQHDVRGEDGMRSVNGLTYYAEAKYTLSPRVFVAVRGERNDYAYIVPVADAPWIASATNMYNGEVGAGYRLDPETIVKASVRADRWDVAPALRDRLRNGAAFALQLSRGFDVFSATWP